MRDPGFESRAGQMGRSVANSSPPMRRFFGAVLPGRLAAGMDPAAHCTASIMKIDLKFIVRQFLELKLVQ